MTSKKLELISNVGSARKVSRLFYSCILTLSVLVVLVGMLPTASAVETSAAPPTSTAAQENAPSATNHWVVPNGWMLYSVPGAVFLGAILGILSIRRALPGTWSLADALSEEVTITPATTKKTITKDATNDSETTTYEYLLDKEGKPILLPEMRASSSRVIALMGMVVIMLMYIGFGTFALYSFGVTGKLSNELKGVESFLISGMTLFAPYVVNKFSSLFQGLTGAK